MTAWMHISQLLATSKYSICCRSASSQIRRFSPPDAGVTRHALTPIPLSGLEPEIVRLLGKQSELERRDEAIGLVSSQQSAGPPQKWRQDGRQIVYTAYFKKSHKLTNSDELAASQILPVTVQNESHSSEDTAAGHWTKYPTYCGWFIARPAMYCTCNVTLRCVLATTVEVEKQLVLHIPSACL